MEAAKDPHRRAAYLELAAWAQSMGYVNLEFMYRERARAA